MYIIKFICYKMFDIFVTIRLICKSGIYIERIIWLAMKRVHDYM